MAFVAAGDYHHHVGLNTFKPSGLYHVAFNYPDRRELARAVRRLQDHGYAVDHATDHGGTVAVYLDDPDGNGIELSYDRPRETWFDADGQPGPQGRPDPAGRDLVGGDGHVAAGLLGGRERVLARGEQQLGRLLAVPAGDAGRGGLAARGGGADAVEHVDRLAERAARQQDPELGALEPRQHVDLAQLAAPARRRSP